MRAVVEMAGLAAATATRVELRRLTRGPLRPAWSYRTELYQALVRALTDRSRRRGIHWLRAAQEAGPKPLPGALATVRFEPVVADGVPCVWALPPGASAGTPGRAIVYFHGGGYVIGSPATHREIAARLTLGVNAPVLLVSYRLAPEHRFPAAHDDCLTALRWLETYPDMFHDWQVQVTMVPEGTAAVASIVRFLRARLD